MYVGYATALFHSKIVADAVPSTYVSHCDGQSVMNVKGYSFPNALLVALLSLFGTATAISEADMQKARRDAGLPPERKESLRDDMKAIAVMFAKYDKDENDKLSMAELKEWVMEEAGGEISKLDMMMAGIDKDKDRMASKEEFVSFLLQIKRSEGPPKSWSMEEEKEMEKRERMEARKKRPIIKPEGMSEEEARKILEANDAKYEKEYAEHSDAADAAEKAASKKKKKKRKKAKVTKDEV